jgi:hypothetical protein
MAANSVFFCATPQDSGYHVEVVAALDARQVAHTQLTLPMAQARGCSEHAHGNPSRLPPRGLPGAARRGMHRRASGTSEINPTGSAWPPSKVR